MSTINLLRKQGFGLIRHCHVLYFETYSSFRDGIGCIVSVVWQDKDTLELYSHMMKVELHENSTPPTKINIIII